MNFLAEKAGNAVPHFSGGGHGVGESDDFVRLRMAQAHQTRDAIDQDGGLAGSGSRDYQHRAVNMVNRLALAIVREKWLGFYFGDSHWGSEYHCAQSAAGN